MTHVQNIARMVRSSLQFFYLKPQICCQSLPPPAKNPAPAFVFFLVANGYELGLSKLPVLPSIWNKVIACPSNQFCCSPNNVDSVACCIDNAGGTNTKVAVFPLEIGTTLTVAGVSGSTMATLTISGEGSAKTVDSGAAASTTFAEAGSTAAPAKSGGGDGGRNIGIGVGVGVGSTLLLVLCAWFLWRLRRRGRGQRPRDICDSGFRRSGGGIGKGDTATDEVEANDTKISRDTKGSDRKTELDGRSRRLELPG